jgi:transposase
LAFWRGWWLRGEDEQTGALFSYLSPDALVPPEHPLRMIRSVVNAALERLSPEFAKLYSPFGRASIPPEKLLRALLLQAFYGVRSERQLMEQVGYNMLFRWFVGLSMDAAVWDVTVFTKNRDRLLEGDIARGLLLAVLADPAVKPLLSTEHFSVDGTMIDAWASMKSFQPKDGSEPPAGPGRNSEHNFHGQKRSNDTHASTTDADARLYRKSSGQPARLCYLGHVVMENRNGLLVDAELTRASGWAERAAAEAMIETVAPAGGVTLGADKAYDAAEHVANLRKIGVTPHVAQNRNGRRSAIDRRTTRHAGYAISQCIRKRIEEPFGWIKQSAGFRKTRHRGIDKVGWMFTLNVAAYNLILLPRLLAAPA